MDAVAPDSAEMLSDQQLALNSDCDDQKNAETFLKTNHNAIQFLLPSICEVSAQKCVRKSEN